MCRKAKRYINHTERCTHRSPSQKNLFRLPSFASLAHSMASIYAYLIYQLNSAVCSSSAALDMYNLLFPPPTVHLVTAVARIPLCGACAHGGRFTVYVSSEAFSSWRLARRGCPRLPICGVPPPEPRFVYYSLLALSFLPSSYPLQRAPCPSPSSALLPPCPNCALPRSSPILQPRRNPHILQVSL